MGSGRELSSVLELEPFVGELSSMPEPESADGVGPAASPLKSEKPAGPLLSSRAVCASSSK